MKQVYTSIILLITMLFGAMAIGQEAQKKFINYQGVARNADGALMSGEPMIIGVKLKFGETSETSYEESHSLTTDANGVFSLLIGNGNTLIGNYSDLPWGAFATYATVSINGNEIGTTELMAVPHALSSADNQWHIAGNDIENKNEGNVFITGSLYASKDFSLLNGAAINEFSTDITLGGNSDNIVPTQKAIKTYVDGKLGESGGGTDDQNAAEVAYDNSTSGLAATTAQAAIDELSTGGVIDADADPTNEIQDISLSGTELSLSNGSTIDLAPIVSPGGTDNQNLILTGDVLTIENGIGSVDLSAYAGDDADADPNNEIQDISLSGTELTISDGSTIDLAPIVPPGGTDNQNLVLTDDVLTIENGTGSVDLKDYFNRTTRHGLLVGDDGIVDGLVGTVDGQVAKWDAALGNWVAGTDETGGGGGALWNDNGGDIYFNGGNVGIGTDNPDVNLHVNSNGQNNLLKLESAGARNWLSYYTSEGYIGYSGVYSGNKDMDFGTGTSNSTGKVHLVTAATPKLTVVANGDVGIGTVNPSAKLDVNGDVKTSGELHSSSTGNANMIPLAYGVIRASGAISSGSGNFTVQVFGNGQYALSIPGESFANATTAVATILGGEPGFITSGINSGYMAVFTFDTNAAPLGKHFSFVIYKE
ncbi:hypothetical protein JQC67_04485 [Aurantibacter crassamenti]|uniref:hypothetical protein n=1 Tax=Aurantibacter crassamenti TaxID=1837375 RepID=UPI00193AAAE0|nr:hypothetical protein [Aurantibacter crassamenti]MBM1105393.1 hypothetical protein [Aurantibacter crassamenti]